MQLDQGEEIHRQEKGRANVLDGHHLRVVWRGVGLSDGPEDVAAGEFVKQDELAFRAIEQGARPAGDQNPGLAAPLALLDDDSARRIAPLASAGPDSGGDLGGTGEHTLEEGVQIIVQAQSHPAGPLISTTPPR